MTNAAAPVPGTPGQRAGATTGTLLVLLAAVLWGTTGTAATFAPSAGPIAIGAAAMGIGGLLQAAVAIRPLRHQAGQLRRHPWMLGIGAVSVMIYPLAFYVGMDLAGVAVGTVVALASGPIFAALLERIVDGVPLDVRWFIGAGLGIGGTVLLTIDGAHGQQAAGGDARDAGAAALGVALALVAGLTYALYTWAVRRLMRAGVGTRAAMGAVFGFGGLFLLPVLLATGAPFLADARNLGVGIYMALIPMFLGYLAFGAGLRTVSARSATVLTLAEPAVAAMLAWWIVGERLGALGISGIALIAACLVVFSAPGRRLSGRVARSRPTPP